MIKLSVRIKADGQTARLAELSGSIEEQEALVDCLDFLMSDPKGTLAVLRADKHSQRHWKDLRVITAGMRREANYALDLWEGEDGPLSEEDQLEVRKLLRSISDTTWHIPGVTAEQPAPLVYPDELTPDLDSVLGWPNFKCGPYAQAFRAAGHSIPEKAEREQAFVLNWLIKLVLRHGADWHAVGGAELKALVPAAAQEGGQGK